MKPAEKNMLESFLQYGDLNNANLVFMGYEEGVWKLPAPHDARISVEARNLLLNDPIFNSCRKYINLKNARDGWYINDNFWDYNRFPYGPLAEAIRAAILNLGFSINWEPGTVNVISIQTRFHWLLQPGNRTHNYAPHERNLYNSYDYRLGRHMIDFYPFPKRSKKRWPPYYLNQFPDLVKYCNYFNAPKNNRWRILENLYNTLPMNCTVAYLGKKRGEFIQRHFYEHVGFQNFRVKDTGQINPNYNGPIRGSSKPKKILIGDRVNKNDQKQVVVLTPFLGMGQFGYEDVDPLSTWL